MLGVSDSESGPGPVKSEELSEAFEGDISEGGGGGKGAGADGVESVGDRDNEVGVGIAGVSNDAERFNRVTVPGATGPPVARTEAYEHGGSGDNENRGTHRKYFCGFAFLCTSRCSVISCHISSSAANVSQVARSIPAFLRSLVSP